MNKNNGIPKTSLGILLGALAMFFCAAPGSGWTAQPPGEASAESQGAVLWEEHVSRPARLQATGYQVVFDVEDTCFEFLGGNWTLAKDGSYVASYYYTINGPGTGAGKGRWIAEGLPAGRYSIETWVTTGDFAADARYEIVHSGGISNVTLNTNQRPAGWYSLGEYALGRTCVVNITDQWSGAGTMLSVDALRFTLLDSLPAPPPFPVRPHIGVCIDDCGQVNPSGSSNPIYKMLRLPFRMTFAVMPLQSYTVATANQVAQFGSEVILHEPMAAITVANPGAGGITDAMTLDQVRAVMATNLDALPHVVGMNNHMGSLITQQSDKMRVCFEELQSRGMFFYDSRTITTTVGYDLAKQMGLLTAERDLFIDGSDKASSMELIRNLALRALYAPNVPHFAIGHVRAGTADALADMAPELAAMGVEIWPLSRCIAQIVEPDAIPTGARLERQGAWTESAADAYSKLLHNQFSLVIGDPAATRNDRAVYSPMLTGGGFFDVLAIWSGDSSNATQARYTIQYAGGSATRVVDQSRNLNEWVYLGRFLSTAGTPIQVTLDDSLCTQEGRPIRADAMEFIRVAGPGETGVVWTLK